MAKTTIQNIDEQIKKLQDKKRELLEKRNIEIGEHLIKSWSLENTDTEDILKLIDKLKPSNN